MARADTELFQDIEEATEAAQEIFGEDLETISIDDAQDHELIAALEALAMALGKNFGDVVQFLDRKTNKAVRVPAPQWFFADTKEYGVEFRQDILRKICEWRAQKDGGLFVVYRIPNEQSAPPEEMPVGEEVTE